MIEAILTEPQSETTAQIRRFQLGDKIGSRSLEVGNELISCRGMFENNDCVPPVL